MRSRRASTSPASPSAGPVPAGAAGLSVHASHYSPKPHCTAVHHHATFMLWMIGCTQGDELNDTVGYVRRRGPGGEGSLWERARSVKDLAGPRREHADRRHPVLLMRFVS